MAKVLASDNDARAISVLRECLTSFEDDISIFTSPLLPDPVDLGEVPTGGIPHIEASMRALESIQVSFRNFVTNAEVLEKTMFLQRLVLLACFSVYFFLINSNPALDTDTKTKYVPILLVGEQPSESLREASRSSHNRGRQQVEQAFEWMVRLQLERRGELGLGEHEYVSRMSSLLPNRDSAAKKSKKERAIWEQFVDNFKTISDSIHDYTQAYIRAFVRAAFSIVDTSPTEVSRLMGRYCGLIYPRKTGAGERYYKPLPEFLDALVLCLLEPRETISIEEFWERAWERFGIIVGGLGNIDRERLFKWGIRQTSLIDLKENARLLTAQLSEMGYVQEYADDIAMIHGGAR